MNLYLNSELEQLRRQLKDMTNLQIVGKAEEQERMNDKAVELENQVERDKGRIFV